MFVLMDGKDRTVHKVIMIIFLLLLFFVFCEHDLGWKGNTKPAVLL